eukprot:m.938273 g.938273  ORF g.938273 m.938273 type:complete len:131 (+) comp23817_c0_seq4:5315-5707(+)
MHSIELASAIPRMHLCVRPRVVHLTWQVSPLTPLTPSPGLRTIGTLEQLSHMAGIATPRRAESAEVLDFVKRVAGTVVPPPSMEQIKHTVINKFGHDAYYQNRTALQRKYGLETTSPTHTKSDTSSGDRP